MTAERGSESCATCRFARPANGGRVECHIRSVDLWPWRRKADWCGEYQAIPTPTPEPRCAKCGDSGIVTDSSGTIGTNCDHVTPTDEQVLACIGRYRNYDGALTAFERDTLQCLDALLAERAGRK